ncbi:hypothetical protein AJ79_04123 [Helicocarpus griseus UAMH5409]|uniref:Uncharacterized protein n=1 Tax=Helicocarpus griseus UAMH5409 TaxID=1447875 RepID=A0A2B7XUK5_9EURO|nr:hypothetical protein AJ79_04123 [Helicocarpus griseus UAMH5409]
MSWFRKMLWVVLNEENRIMWPLFCLDLSKRNSYKSAKMCNTYITTTITSAGYIKNAYTKACPHKPRGVEPEDCPEYKFHESGSSRKKDKLPEWAKRKPTGPKA